jgi:hypothetical protein
MNAPRLALCLLCLVALLAPGAPASLAQPIAFLATDASADAWLAPGDEFWAADFHLPGTAGWVSALAFAPDGSLYTGGYFGAAGGVAANNIARWDGVQWHPLGSGTSSPVFALAFGADGSLYTGGQFTAAGGKPSSYIARWLKEVRMTSVIRFPIVSIHQ